MDVATATKQINILIDMNENYLQQMKDINTSLTIDDINNDISLNKTMGLGTTELDAKNVANSGTNVLILAKKIADNIAAINNISAQTQIDDSYFEDFVILAKYRAKFVSNTVPGSAKSNVLLNLSAIFSNIGFSMWDSNIVDFSLQVISQDVKNVYSQNYYASLPADIVNIGDNVTISISITTPSIIGAYTIIGSLRINSVNFNEDFTNYIYIE